MTGLSFDEYNPSRIFSTGRDGFVRLLDFRSEVFDEVWFQLNVLGNVTNFFYYRFTILPKCPKLHFPSVTFRKIHLR